MDTTVKQELENLLSALMDGALGDDQQQRLGELLQQHAEARELYLAYFDLHTELSLTGGSADVGNLEPPAPATPPQRPPALQRRAFRWRSLSAALVLVLLLIAGWLAWRPGSKPVPTPLADLIESTSVQWDEGSTPISADGAIPPGTLLLKQGETLIRMRSGAELVCAGPLRLELLDSKAVRLLSGNLTIKVPDEAIGFRVITPTTDVVDMGTEFGVAVEESGATEVHVSQGIVVARSAAGSGVVPILEQEAGRVDVPRDKHDMSPGDFVSIEFNPSRFPGLSSGQRAADQKFTQSPGRPVAKLPPGSRIIFLGDRATSRETHLLLINQALADLPEAQAPRLLNAGVAFRLLFDEAEFQDEVAALRPTHAVLEFGPELAGVHRPWSVERYRSAVTRLVDRLQQAGIEPILETGFVGSPNQTPAAELLSAYNGVLRELARSRKLRLADAEQLVRKSGNATSLVGKFDIPTFEGYRVIAASLLQAIGYPEVNVPESLELDLLPGVIRQWKLRWKPSDDCLDAERAGRLEPGEDWITLNLPQQDDFSKRLPVPSQSFAYQDRARGYAVQSGFVRGSLTEAVGYVDSPSERDAFLNMGGNVIAVWLNGQEVVARDRDWAGWHPGKERIGVRLRAGRNKIVVEASNGFFVSVTDERDWPLPRSGSE